MHVVILSKGRAETIQTHKLFTNYTLVLHTEEDREEYLKNPTISPEKIVVSNMPPGVANQRQWIQEELIPEGDWYISLDDNIHGFQVVPDDLYSEDFLPVKKDSSLKAAFETPCNSERFLRLCEGLAAKGEKERA